MRHKFTKEECQRGSEKGRIKRAVTQRKFSLAKRIIKDLNIDIGFVVAKGGK